MLKMLSFKKGLVIEARLLLLAQFFIEMDLLISFLLEPSLFASLSFDALQFLKALPLLQLLLVLFFLEALLQNDPDCSRLLTHFYLLIHIA